MVGYPYEAPTGLATIEIRPPLTPPVGGGFAML